ncbi:MAG TPA: hypothetical protein VJ032_07445 [Thermoanaerobaculia bacterium]|nr:hypothetical protein [Thermoanaerobaculia bacterium]
MIGFVGFVAAAAVLKLSLKLIFLPILIIAFVVKLVAFLVIGAVAIAILVPLALVLLIFVGPFVAIAAAVA